MALHARLANAKSEFRLIRMLEKSRTLALELANFSMHDTVPWVALSYCWRNQAATETVTVNGKDFGV